MDWGGGREGEKVGGDLISMSVTVQLLCYAASMRIHAHWLSSGQNVSTTASTIRYTLLHSITFHLLGGALDRLRKKTPSGRADNIVHLRSIYESRPLHRVWRVH